MKTMFLQELTGGLFGGLLNGLLNRRFKGLFAKTPVLAVLLLTAVIAACASDDSNSSNPPPSPPPPPTTKADCIFAEGAAAAVDGYTGCELFALPQVPQVIDSDNIIYNVTAGVINKGSNDSFGDNNRFESAVSNFIFTQIINGNTSNPRVVGSTNNNQLTLSVNATALNITFLGIHADLFGEFYIELVKSDDDTVKVRYTITITAVNDAPVFEAVMGSESQFNEANETTATPARYTFADIPFNSFIGYSVGNVSASDMADNDTITYSISGGTNVTKLFQINSATGEITLKKVAVNTGPYTFNVTASDGKKDGIAMAEITVSVLSAGPVSPPNQAPVFVAGNSPGVKFTPANVTTPTPASYRFAGIPISFPIGYLAGNVSATDANNDAISYNISGGDEDNALFEINPTTGEINLKDTAANAGNYTFNTTASDGKGGSTTATITVTVDDTPPVFTETTYSSGVTLAVASAAGAIAGNVWAVDEAETPFDYSLAGNSDLFGLASADNADGTRSIITTRAATLSDFAVPSVTFQVIATHQVGGLSSTANIRITLISNSDTDGINDFYDSFPFNGAMNVTGSGNSSHPYIISNIYQLQAIAGVDHTGTALDSSDFTNNGFLYGTNAADQLTKHYILANDIDASATNTGLWNKSAVGSDNFIGRGWTPIAGNSSQSFSGSFNGEGYAINSLEIQARQGDNSKHFGLFGINNGNITAVGLQSINMTIQAPGNHYSQKSGANLLSGSHAGGLVGLNQNNGVITYSYATGLVNASFDAIGGLVGLNQEEISYSYSTATVQGAGATGGLVGINSGGSVLSSYGAGMVRGSVGANSISQEDNPSPGIQGGLIGYALNGGIVNVSYAAGLITDATPHLGSDYGGIIAIRRDDDVTVEASYWDNETTGTTLDFGVESIISSTPDTTSLTTAQLQGCQLDETPIAGVDPVPDCTGLFPSSHWGGNVDIPADIIYGWEFNAGKYPSLSAVRPSDFKGLLPSAEDQQCHRNGMPLGC